MLIFIKKTFEDRKGQSGQITTVFLVLYNENTECKPRNLNKGRKDSPKKQKRTIHGEGPWL